MFAEFSKIIEKVRQMTEDFEGLYWSDSQLASFINEGQDEFCTETEILRHESPIHLRENGLVYTLPLDCYKVVRFERYDGREICKTSSNDLQNTNGSLWRQITGEPTHYYQDLDGEGQFRFFPSPLEDLREDYTQFTGEVGSLVSAQNADDDSAVTTDQELGSVVDVSDPSKDEIFFTSERGVVRQVIQSDSFMRVFYVRYPRENTLEIKDVEALKYFCLHKCYEQDGNLFNPERSLYYRQMFDLRMRRAIGRVSSSYGGKQRVKGSWF